MGEMHSDHPIYGLEPPFSRALKQKNVIARGSLASGPVGIAHSCPTGDPPLSVHSLESQFSRELKQTRSQHASARGPPGGGPPGWGPVGIAHSCPWGDPPLRSRELH